MSRRYLTRPSRFLLPEGTYFRPTRAKDRATFTVEARIERIPTGHSSYGPNVVSTITVDMPGAASAARELAAEMTGAPYGRMHPAIRFRHMNLGGVRVVHTFWTEGRQ